jgi:membrane-associated phospholipid phosphatase
MGSAAAGRSNRLAWGAIAALLVVDLVWLTQSAISVAPLSLACPVAAGFAMAGLAVFYRQRRNEPKLADALDGIGQMIAFMSVGALFSYLVASLKFPLQDAAFYQIDRALALDWLAYLKFVDARPWLGQLFSLAYASFIPQVLVLLLGLAFSGRGLAARTMVLAMIVAGFVTITISGFLPAMAMFVHLGLGPADYPNLAPGAAFVHVADMQALRSGLPVTLDLTQAQGIITFPSYHAALGLIMLMAGLSQRWLRWPFIVLNLLMIAATPIDGGHYFIDVLAGLVIAIVSQLAARRLLGRDLAERGLQRGAPGGQILVGG